ncbi:hypothetical protein, partial [Ferrimicrobium sp.]|uniref:hypothetical protein n=1 Tax=Ferrimicrobium sp. TaxID=2926050 RepID=UPI00262FEF78
MEINAFEVDRDSRSGLIGSGYPVRLLSVRAVTSGVIRSAMAVVALVGAVGLASLGSSDLAHSALTVNNQPAPAPSTGSCGPGSTYSSACTGNEWLLAYSSVNQPDGPPQPSFGQSASFYYEDETPYFSSLQSALPGQPTPPAQSSATAPTLQIFNSSGTAVYSKTYPGSSKTPQTVYDGSYSAPSSSELAYLSSLAPTNRVSSPVQTGSTPNAYDNYVPANIGEGKVVTPFVARFNISIPTASALSADNDGVSASSYTARFTVWDGDNNFDTYTWTLPSQQLTTPTTSGQISLAKLVSVNNGTPTDAAAISPSELNKGVSGYFQLIPSVDGYIQGGVDVADQLPVYPGLTYGSPLVTNENADFNNGLSGGTSSPLCSLTSASSSLACTFALGNGGPSLASETFSAFTSVATIQVPFTIASSASPGVITNGGGISSADPAFASAETENSNGYVTPIVRYSNQVDIVLSDFNDNISGCIVDTTEWNFNIPGVGSSSAPRSIIVVFQESNGTDIAVTIPIDIANSKGTAHYITDSYLNDTPIGGYAAGYNFHISDGPGCSLTAPVLSISKDQSLNGSTSGQGALTFTPTGG